MTADTNTQDTGGDVGQPRRMPQQNLAGLFTDPTKAPPPDRTTGLGDLVRRKPAARQEPPAAAEPATPPPTPAALPAQPPDRAPDSRTPPPPAWTPTAGNDPSRTGTLHITAVLVSPTVAARLDQYRRAAKGRTNTSVVLQALDDCHERVPDIVAEARAAAQPRSSLFPVRDDHLRLPGAGPVQVQVRPTIAQLDVLDSLVRNHGLESRSQLVATVLNEFLPGKKDR